MGGLGEKATPSLAGRFDNRFVGFEHAVREPVLAQVLPDVLDRIELGGARGQEDEGDWHDQATGRMPAGPIEEEHGVGAAPDAARDLDEVELHRLAVGVGHGERRAGAARRADGTEQVGAFVALIGGLAWARGAPRPLPHEAVLLADAGFVLEPDLDRLALRQAGAVSVQRRGEVLWEGPPLLLRRRYAAGLTLRERSGRWRSRCLGLILARTAAASQGWTERVASSCGDASLGRASSVLPERCRPA